MGRIVTIEGIRLKDKFCEEFSFHPSWLPVLGLVSTGLVAGATARKAYTLPATQEKAVGLGFSGLELKWRRMYG